MRLTDNSSVAKSEFEADYPQLSEKLLDRTLESLSQEDNILIFPHDLLDSPDLEKDGKVLETGKIVTSGTGAELLADEAVKKAYLGG